MKLSLVRAPGIETLDGITRANTAFATFAELLNAPAYTPSLDVSDDGRWVLATAYDAAQAAKGDSRRAFIWRSKKAGRA